MHAAIYGAKLVTDEYRTPDDRVNNPINNDTPKLIIAVVRFIMAIFLTSMHNVNIPLKLMVSLLDVVFT